MSAFFEIATRGVTTRHTSAIRRSMSVSGSPEVLISTHCDGTVAVVTMNRPDMMNAINEAMSAALARAFWLLDSPSHDQVRAIILTGAGRAFSAGIDLTAPVDASRAAADTVVALSTNPVRAMEECSKPIIGAVNGPAVTGAFGACRCLGVSLRLLNRLSRFAQSQRSSHPELALACDTLVATPKVC